VYHDRIYLLCRILILTAVFLLIPAGNPSAGEQNDWRVGAGLELFPSLLAADIDIAGKSGSDGRLLLLLVCPDRKDRAEEAALELKKIGQIRGIPIRIELTHDTAFKEYEHVKAAGIFLISPLGDEFESLVRYGRAHQTIVFSPFEGDVERGASGGILISDRILPYLNMESLRLSKIRIKPFFLRIAEQYE
jgi:hypothetical protein